ncbi:MAG: hypothetical protein M3Z96_03500 [Pseudomonadota bacterium]|nr:hypothetical protein [Pseudomonadota bacterium]
MARLTKLSPDNAQWKQDLARFDRDIREARETVRPVSNAGVEPAPVSFESPASIAFASSRFRGYVEPAAAGRTSPASRSPFFPPGGERPQLLIKT